MTTHAITIEIDDAKLTRCSDGFLATCWHVAQANPAGYGDYLAGELAEQIGREIIRRWLLGVQPELWHHQGVDHFRRELARFAKYEPGGPAARELAELGHGGTRRGERGLTVYRTSRHDRPFRRAGPYRERRPLTAYCAVSRTVSVLRWLEETCCRYGSGSWSLAGPAISCSAPPASVNSS